MRTGTEQRYIEHIDRPQEDRELKGAGFNAEEVAVSFFKHMGLDARFSTHEEDAGKRGSADIGPKPIIDGVVYREKHPIMPFQLTTSKSPRFRQEKMDQLKNKPFVRLSEMKPSDPAIPKTLIYMDAEATQNFQKDPDFSKHPEVAIQILNSAISSLKFDITQTKNPLEQKAAQELIQMFEQERKKYIH